MCRTLPKQVRAVTSEVSNDQFLGVVTTPNSCNLWNVTVLLNGNAVEFKLDTGADVSVISEEIFKTLEISSLHTTDTNLTGAGSQPLQVCGKFEADLQYKARSSRQTVYVVSTLSKALLGKPAIESLNLITRIDSVDKDSCRAKHPELFTSLGSLKGEYKIKLKPNSVPFALTTPRRVAHSLMPRVREELERMEKIGVITKISEPTEWCAGIVVVPKPNGKIRICVDLTKLNESVCRERHVLPAVDHVLAQLSGATVFSKLDTNSGFWQIRLAEESCKLTTFITPMGRYCFNRLPFGITSAPEHFQRKMSQMLEGQKGVVCMMDDILVYGSTQDEHDSHLTSVLDKIKASGATLNEHKCQFSKKSIKFLGHIIDSKGIHPDPHKVQAIVKMKSLTNVPEVRRFLGMVHQMSKFAPHLADKAKPLCDLVSPKNQWVWTETQQQAFDKIKQELSSQPVLAMYNPEADTIIAADVSSIGLGAVLTQKQQNGKWLPTTYASRALTPTESRYAQIEKEALAITYACERFQEYLMGKSFHVHTDHKSLVPIFSTKSLDELPLRVQRFRLRLLRFQFTISHIPGKDLTTADTLSRAPLQNLSTMDAKLQEDCDAYVALQITSIPATESRLNQIKECLKHDEVSQQLMEFCESGWPDKVTGPAKQYLPVASELQVQDGLLLRGSRLIIPNSMRQDILSCLHAGHQGITKCRKRAKVSVRWPGLGKQITDTVQSCKICCKFGCQPVEPLLSTPFPELPWQKVGMDLFTWKSTKYLLVIDYYSRYIEIAKLPTESSNDTINLLKLIFA